MTSKQLSRLYWLERDIADSEARLNIMRTKAEPGASKISGIPSGGSDLRAGENVKIEIAEQSRQLDLMRARAERERASILRYICSVDDPQMRLIIKYRFLDFLPWHVVAWKLGGGNTGDGVRKRLTRFLAAECGAPE